MKVTEKTKKVQSSKLCPSIFGNKSRNDFYFDEKQSVL